MEIEYQNHTCNHEAIVAKFKNGQLLDKSYLKDIKYYSCENKVGQLGKKRKVLVTETERLQYAGANFGPSSSNLDEHSRYYIGIANKKTKKVKVMDCSFFDLRPTIMGSIFKEKSIPEQQTKEIRSRMEQNNDLILTFGSLKSRRITESRLKHSVALPELNDVMARSMEGMKFQLNFDQAGDTKIFPLVNRNARCVGDLYQMRDLIYEEEDVVLTDLAENLTDTSAGVLETLRKDLFYDDFVLNLLSSLNDNSSRPEKTKLILYIQYLIFFMRIKCQEDRLHIPKGLRMVMTDKFYGDGVEHDKFAHPNPKCIYRVKAFMVAMILIVKDYHIVDALEIAKITGLVPKELQAVVNGIGATWIKENKKFACPSIKVNFPIPPAKFAKSAIQRKKK